MIDVVLRNVYLVMSATEPTRNLPQWSVDWGATVRLAIVVSVVAAIATLTLASRVAGPVLIAGVVVAASMVSWHHASPAARPATVRIRRR